MPARAGVSNSPQCVPKWTPGRNGWVSILAHGFENKNHSSFLKSAMIFSIALVFWVNSVFISGGLGWCFIGTINLNSHM